MNNTYYDRRFSRYSVSIDNNHSQAKQYIDKTAHLDSYLHPSFSINSKKYLTLHDRSNNNIANGQLPQKLTTLLYESNNNVDQENGKEVDELRPLGLQNRKTHCFMNSVIQSLRHCNEFVYTVLNYRLDFNYLKLKSNEKDINLISAFFDLTHDLAYRDEEAVKRSSITFQNYHENYPDFANGEQDADEYLQFLLNKLNDVTKAELSPQRKMENKMIQPKFITDSDEAFRIFYEENMSFTTKLFCGQMNNEMSCEKCTFRKPSFQVFWVLSVPIVSQNDFENDIPLENCIDALGNLQKVHVNNCYQCKQCDSMYLRTIITHWPKYLIIHVKRNLEVGQNLKDEIKITWPLEKNLMVPKDQEFYCYSLLGVIDHIGSITSGHYVSKFRDPNDINYWWCFNDMNVSKIISPDKDVITGNTTTYFFQR